MSALAPVPKLRGAELALRCHPGRAGRRLTFPYRLENLGAADLYVMDAIPIPAPGGEAVADDQAVVIIFGPGGDVLLGKFPAPLPTDRRVAVPVVPLARRLAPGETLERDLSVPLPLAETSPYFPDLSLRQYEPVDLAAVVFMIGYWIAEEGGLAAAPAETAPGLWHVTTRHTLKDAHLARQRFPAKGLQIFKRLDSFPRPDPA